LRRFEHEGWVHSEPKVSTVTATARSGGCAKAAVTSLPRPEAGTDYVLIARATAEQPFPALIADLNRRFARSSTPERAVDGALLPK
jgi:hypothetical protein